MTDGEQEELPRTERHINTTLRSKDGAVKNYDDAQIQTTLNTAEYRDFRELADSYFKNEAQAARKLITLGMHAFVEHDPRTQNQESTDNAVTIRDYIPEGEKNAVDVREQLIKEIEDDLLDIVSNDPEVTLDGWKAYK
jgi:hypothetical protein